MARWSFILIVLAESLAITSLTIGSVVAADHKFYPLGYVPPSVPTNGANTTTDTHFYPPGSFAQPPAQATIPERRAVALTLPGTQIVKVGLVLNASAVNVVAIDDLEVHDNTVDTSLAILPASSVWRIVDDGTQLRFELVDLNLGFLLGSNNMQINKSDGATVRHESFALPINMPKSFSGAAQYNDGYTLTGHIQDGLFGLNNKAYRGGLWLHTLTTAAFSTINVLNLEDYLLSVVPSEMPSNWPLEALKAQAIAARSYALANLGKHGSQGFDVKADTEDQMYTGVLAETEASNRAVAETAGIVIKNQGKVVPAFYHSTSGGSTEIALGKNYPFLQEVADYDDASPKFTWTKKISIYDLEQALKSKTQKDPIGQPQNIIVLSRSPANNTLKILVTGDLGSVELSGEQSRALFGLPSSSFNAAIDNGNQLCVFSGRGFGHRMGLSQWGAKALAEHGYNAAQILGYYYKDVSLEYP